MNEHLEQSNMNILFMKEHSALNMTVIYKKSRKRKDISVVREAGKCLREEKVCLRIKTNFQWQGVMIIDLLKFKVPPKKLHQPWFDHFNHTKNLPQICHTFLTNGCYGSLGIYKSQ